MSVETKKVPRGSVTAFWGVPSSWGTSKQHMETITLRLSSVPIQPPRSQSGNDRETQPRLANHQPISSHPRAFPMQVLTQSNSLGTKKENSVAATSFGRSTREIGKSRRLLPQRSSSCLLPPLRLLTWSSNARVWQKTGKLHNLEVKTLYLDQDIASKLDPPGRNTSPMLWHTLLSSPWTREP